MSEEKEIIKLDPRDIEPHPESDRRYSADEEREFTNLDEEPLEAPKVTRESYFTDADWTVISGHRRIEELIESGESTIEVEVVGPFESRREELRATLDYNDYRVKTPGEMVMEAFDRIRIREDSVETGLENFPSGYRDQLDDLFRHSGRTLEKGLKVKWAADEGEFEGDQLDEETRSVAEEQWEALINDEASFDGAIEEVRVQKDRKESARRRERLRERKDLEINFAEESDGGVQTDPLPDLVRAFVWYGNKAELADWIISRMPEHETYVEPFAGNAAVLFNKPPSRIEVINDADPDIANFFEVLRDKRDLLEQSAQSISYTEEAHERWSNKWFGGEDLEDDVQRAAVFLFLTQAQLYGKMGSPSSFDEANATPYYNQLQRLPDLQKRLTRDDPAYFTERFVEQVGDVAVLPEQRKRDINRGEPVKIRQGDFEDVLREFDSESTLAYVDPPYYGTEEHYPENFEEDDHQRLVDALNDFDGDWMLSYGSEPPENLQTDHVEPPKTVIRSPGQETKGTEGEEWLITNIPEERIGTFETVHLQKPADEW